MYLQTILYTLSHATQQGIQNYQNYVYAPLNSKLDSITEQIIDTQNSALKVMNHIEDGSVKRMWEAQKKLPSVTWLGNVMDRLFGWGNYYSTTPKRTLLEEEKYLGGWPCPTDNFYRYNMTTSYEAGTNADQSCNYVNSTEYRVSTQRASILRSISGPEDIICRIDACVVYYFKACIPDCLPCLNATDSERTNFLNDSRVQQTFFSEVDNLVWLFTIATQSNQSKINKWKQDQIFNFFKRTFTYCVDKSLQPEIDSRIYYVLLIIPIAALGIGVYIKCRSKPKTLEYSSVDNIN